MSRRRNIIIGSLVSIAVCCLVGTIGVAVALNAFAGVRSWMMEADGCLGTTPLTRDTVEKLAGVRLPATIRQLRVATQRLQSCAIFVSFQMNRNDLPNFLSSTSLLHALTLSASIAPFRNAPASMGWRFEGQKPYLVGEGTRGTAHQYVAVDPAGSLVTVYLITRVQ